MATRVAGNAIRSRGLIATGALLAALVTSSCSSYVRVDARHRETPRAERPAIRLVLQITLDQMRGDLLLATRDRWSRGGLRRLHEDGAVFADAHHGHANTETVVGHATLATGADPSVHGMVGNVWFDRAKGAMHYNVEDPRFQAVGNDRVAVTAAGHPEVTEKASGRSPEAMLAPTIADSIAKAGGGKAKVFAVSLKDRGAVPMAGRSGKALWWSDASGEFISSTYYYPEGKLPLWAARWSRAHEADRFDGQSWNLLLDPETYRAIGRDEMPWEEPPAGMGRSFPHLIDRRVLGDKFYSALEATPFGDQLLLDFTRDLLRGEDIGRDDVVDYLSVAFSSPDYIGHRFGPSSLEMEDEILRIDRVIAGLLHAVDEIAGDDHVLVVLSSDHGVGEAPEELVALGRDGGRVVLSQAEKSESVQQLTTRLGGKLILRQWQPYVYLDVDALRAHGVDPEAAARQLAEEYTKVQGVEAAFTRGQIVDGKLPDTAIARAVGRNFHPSRSGDIHLVTTPGWQIAYEGPGAARYAAGHGSPWPYDTFVPLVIAGPGVPSATVARRVETVDIAPTIAALVGVPVPELSTGKVLGETLAGGDR